MNPKIKLVMASVLKPVDDTRMYEKFARSILKINTYDISIIGFATKSPKEVDRNIKILHTFNFNRTSIKRLWAPWIYYKKLLKVKPKVIIVNTHELLIVSVLYKILFGAELLYDVQENYFRNIWYGNSFPPLIKQLLALKVRATEKLTRSFVSFYFLAEKNYEKEFSFTKGKSLILENKYQKIENIQKWDKYIPFKKPGKIRLLYTGTISYNYGIMEAIDIANKISNIDPDFELHIIGYCADNKLLTEILRRIKSNKNIFFSGGSFPVPYHAIIQAIKTSDIGLLPYRSDPSIKNCTPTKIYEYLTHRLPMIVQEHQAWGHLIDVYKAGIHINYKKTNAHRLIEMLKTQNFYDKQPGNEVMWQSEEPKLLKYLQNSANKISNQ